MKREVFNRYVDSVCEELKVAREELFNKNKSTRVSNARHILFYLCVNRPMRVALVQEYMKEKGYDTNHRTITYGVNKIKEARKKDQDLRALIIKVK